MIVGVPKELGQETRVGLLPRQVASLRASGHQVVVESGAGTASSVVDEKYVEVGATVVQGAKEVWGEADLVVKVQEARPSEFGFFRPGLVLFGYMHLAVHPDLVDALVAARVTAVAYETMRATDGSLPLLIPMSEIAGQMAVHIGTQYLWTVKGGRGVLVGGIPGLPSANILILGGGAVGYRAAKTALGVGARVCVLERSLDRMRKLDDLFRGRVATLFCNKDTIQESLPRADVVIGAAMIPGSPSPKLIRREMISMLKEGSVLVDVAIDQGGCFETSHVTDHSDPVYVVDTVLHYCVPNIAAAVPRTASEALTNAVFPYLLQMANNGVIRARKENSTIREGFNVYNGSVIHPLVAKSLARLPKTSSTSRLS